MPITCSAYTFRCVIFSLGKSQTLIHIMHTALLDCFLSTGYTEKPHSLRIQRMRQATEDLGDLLGVPACIRAWIWTWPAYDAICFLPCIVLRHVLRIRTLKFYLFIMCMCVGTWSHGTCMVRGQPAGVSSLLLSYESPWLNSSLQDCQQASLSDEPFHGLKNWIFF